MAGQIDEQVLERFVVSENDFKDLDSIIRARCDFVKYFVFKGGTLGGYDTDHVEELLRERNGDKDRIASVRICAVGQEGLEFNVEFDDGVIINGQCQDRAPLALLATEVRAVIQDRMKGRRFKRGTVLQIIAAIVFILGYFGLQTFQNDYTDRFNAQQSAKAEHLTRPYQQELQAAVPSNKSLLAEANRALSAHNVNEEIEFLVRQQADQLRQQIINVREGAVTAPIYNPSPPWWSSSYWLVVGVSAVLALIAVGVGYLTVPGDEGIFLIGDQRQRQERLNRRRERIVWGILVAFAIGVASGFVSSLR